MYTVTFIGSIVFSFLGNLLTAKANNQIMYKINRDVLQKIHTISLLDVRSENAASLTQKINNDSYQVSSFFLEFFSNSVINLIMGLFAICYTFYYNLGIALILIGSISASVKRNHLIIVITHDDTLIPYFDKIITLQPCMW